MRAVVERAAEGWTISTSSGHERTGGSRRWTPAFELSLGGRAATVELDRPCVSIAAGRLVPVIEPADRVPKPLRVEPLRGIKPWLRRLLDWEYVTPVDEIDARRWQGRLKRILRKVKG